MQASADKDNCSGYNQPRKGNLQPQTGPSNELPTQLVSIITQIQFRLGLQLSVLY